MNPNLNTIDQARRDISKPLNESNGITKTTRLAMGAVLILAALGCGASKEGLYASSTSDRPTNSDVSPSDISTVEDHLDSNSLDRFGDQDIEGPETPTDIQIDITHDDRSNLPDQLDNDTVGEDITDLGIPPSDFPDSGNVIDIAIIDARDGGIDDNGADVITAQDVVTVDNGQIDVADFDSATDVTDAETIDAPSDIGTRSDADSGDTPDIFHEDSARDSGVFPRTEPCYFPEVITFPNGYMVGPAGSTRTYFGETSVTRRVVANGIVDSTEHCFIVRGTAVDRRDGGLTVRDLSAEIRVRGVVIGPTVYVDRRTFGTANSTLLPLESPGVLCFRATRVVSGEFEIGGSFPPDAAVAPIRFFPTSAAAGNCEVIYGITNSTR